MIKLSKKEELEKKIYYEIFMQQHPCCVSGDSNKIEIKNEKYSSKLKGNLIKQILIKYSLLDKNIVNKIKKCLPNGFNEDYSIEDNEYELLLNEFKGVIAK